MREVSHSVHLPSILAILAVRQRREYQKRHFARYQHHALLTLSKSRGRCTSSIANLHRFTKTIAKTSSKIANGSQTLRAAIVCYMAGTRSTAYIIVPFQTAPYYSSHCSSSCSGSSAHAWRRIQSGSSFWLEILFTGAIAECAAEGRRKTRRKHSIRIAHSENDLKRNRRSSIAETRRCRR